MKKYMTFEKPNDELSSNFGQKVKEVLNSHGYIEDTEHPEVVFVIGGDGTFIYAVHQILRKKGIGLKDVLFYGIHTGTLGFYTDFKDDEFEEFMNAFLDGKYEVVEYPLLNAITDGKEKHNAINEVRVENAKKTQVIDVYINGEYFETFRGSGLCVCTQLGSTAFNRSLGGAVIQDGLPLIEMVEIAGIHHVKYRSLEAPMVLKDDVELTLKSDSFDGAVLGIDSDVYPLDDVKEITICKCNSASVPMVKGKQVSWFHKLKSLF